MLRAIVQQLGDARILCCRGRLVTGEAGAILHDMATTQGHARLLVLDLAEVDAIDAGGLGVLLGLRQWARANAIEFKLMNVINRVQHVLELTALDSVFEYCSVPESLCLMHRATAMDSRPFEEPNLAEPMNVAACLSAVGISKTSQTSQALLANPLNP